MRAFCFLSFLVLCISVLSQACGDKSSNHDNTNGNNKRTNDNNNVNRINWEAIPREFNPKVDDIAFGIEGVDRLKLNVFGFKDDVEIIYSPDVSKNTGKLKVFRVWKDMASFGELQARQVGREARLVANGQYQCSIRVEDGNITALKGGCYVRLQVFLPTGAEVEVYNADTLLSKRFIPIDAELFLENLDKATWSDQKFDVIEDFLVSYVNTNKKPTLTSAQLSKAIQEFSQGEEKLKALRKLHAAVSDRANLADMIEKVFGYFDRDEARSIVGI